VLSLHRANAYLCIPNFILNSLALKKKKRKLRTIGRIDKADFPELNLQNIEVKIDTGAYTSAIHCDYIEENPPKIWNFLPINTL